MELVRGRSWEVDGIADQGMDVDILVVIDLSKHDVDVAASGVEGSPNDRSDVLGQATEQGKAAGLGDRCAGADEEDESPITMSIDHFLRQVYSPEEHLKIV